MSTESAAQAPSPKPRERIVGFDLARAYAIFGMFVVNFQYVYGSLTDESTIGKFLTLFAGNSSSAFVILAGIGCSILAGRIDASDEERARRRAIVLRRSWFLFFAGLALYPWWPADILHFYGGYMHLAAFFLFASGRMLFGIAALCVVVFHALLFVIPYQSGWRFETLEYVDFWTISGFVRNTLYNGWNPIFPWAAYFFVGMVLGRLDWSDRSVRRRLVIGAAIVFAAFHGLIALAERGAFSGDLSLFFTSDYLPPFLPFLATTGAFAILLIVICVTLGERFADRGWLRFLAANGRLTLTHYLLHLTLGMIVVGEVLGRRYGDTVTGVEPEPGSTIALVVVVWTFVTFVAGAAWASRFRHGPLEALMRRVSG